jgi:ketosteroid isomerase-like protein
VTPEQIVRANFDAYLNQDRAACETLLSDEFVFTSPQDDHIDRQTFLERCFPTAERFSRHELIHVVQAGDGDVFVLYEYDLATGGTFRNTEVITVAGEHIVEAQVFFGGRVD